jgi:S1-C subfamily serine protease
MLDTRRAASGAFACLVAAFTFLACGDPERVQIASLTATPAGQVVARSAPSSPPATVSAAGTTPPSAVPSSPAVRPPTAAPSPSPGASRTTAAAPAGCTPESVLRQVRPSLVRVVNDRGQGRFSVGTGYAVAPNGQLITNEHVVNGAVQLSVVLADGRQLPAQVLRADEGRDLALLDVPGATFPPVRFSREPGPTAGERIFAAGFPQSAAPTLEPTLTGGTLIRTDVISGATFLRTEVPAGVGNSGGPLLTACGEVIGTVSSGAAQSAGITFAVALQEIEAFLAGAPPLRLGGPVPASAPSAAPPGTRISTATPRPEPSIPPTRAAVPGGQRTSSGGGGGGGPPRPPAPPPARLVARCSPPVARPFSG